MSFEIEVVKSHGADILSDDIYGMSQCPECGFDLADCWSYCPNCGEGPFEDACQAVATCCDEQGDFGMFRCSSCGRTYAVLQVGSKVAEWNCCPGCMARLI